MPVRGAGGLVCSSSPDSRVNLARREAETPLIVAVQISEAGQAPVRRHAVGELRRVDNQS